MLNRPRLRAPKIFLPLLLLGSSLATIAQDNSPYSRYGLGDAVPISNISTRAMGGITAGYADAFSINFSNPASYSQFMSYIEQRTKKQTYGRVVLDVGMNFDNRTLITPNTTNKFTSADAFFSYLQLGVPLRKNWGLSFGLRPLTRISYLISRTERLNDPVTGLPIDSAITQFKGSGGSYLPTIGTGVAIKNFSIGANVGYLFGTRENSTLRSLINDSVLYYSSDHTTNTSFGSVFINGGVQYLIDLTKNKATNKTSKTSLRLGVSGSWEQKINGSQDVLRQTFTRGSAGEELQIDSVYQESGVKGTIIYPAMYKAGFVLQHSKSDFSGWLFGVDYSATKWSNYRYFGQADSVQDGWQVNVGAQLSPRPRANYFSRVSYRFGFYAGSDYLHVQGKLPVYGGSFGLALPIGNYNRLSPNQVSVVNLAFEYGKRGNDDNLLKENLFRISVGFNFTDLWFGKRKYE